VAARRVKVVAIRQSASARGPRHSGEAQCPSKHTCSIRLISRLAFKGSRHLELRKEKHRNNDTISLVSPFTLSNQEPILRSREKRQRCGNLQHNVLRVFRIKNYFLLYYNYYTVLPTISTVAYYNAVNSKAVGHSR
jgi:hypothetical protein